MNTNINNSINFTIIKYKNNITGGSNNIEYTIPYDKGITIYTKTNCPYCKKALELINKKYKKEDIEVIDVLENYIKEDTYEKDKQSFLTFIKKHTKKDYETFPMIFIDGKFIGGFDDLNSMKGGENIYETKKTYKIIQI